MNNQLNVSIDKYQTDDWGAVCVVHDRARPLEVGGFMPGDVVDCMTAVYEEDGFFDGQQFVARLNEKVVGFVCIDGEELTWLYVDPEYHRQGIGRLLMEHVRPMIGPDGHVLAVNPLAIQFYQQMGFEICAEFPGGCQGYACTCIRLAFPGSPRADRAPVPMKESLLLAGFDESDWGTAVKDSDGIWRWRHIPKLWRLI